MRPGINADLLVDGVVLQAARLVARLVTRPGELGLVGHLPDLFLKGLLDELAGLQLSQRTIAARWDASLRTLNSRLRTLPARMQQRRATLLQRIMDFVEREQPVDRVRLETEFSGTEARLLSGALAGLVDQGLLSLTGRGAGRRYRVVPRDAQLLDQGQDRDAAEALLRVTLHRSDGLSRDELERRLGAQGHPERQARLHALLDDLVAHGDVAQEGAIYRCDRYDLPSSSATHFSASVLDHFNALTEALVARLDEVAHRAGARRPAPARSGEGSTYHFDILEDDPLGAEVDATFAELRDRLTALRARIDARNDGLDGQQPSRRESFYLGRLRGTRLSDD